MADWVLTDDEVVVNFGRFKITLTIKDYDPAVPDADDMRVIELGAFKYGQVGGNQFLVGCDSFDLSFYWEEEYSTKGYFALIDYLSSHKTYVDVHITPDGTGATWDHWEHGTVDKSSISGDWKSKRISLNVQIGATRIGASLTKNSEYSLGAVKLHEYIEEIISDDAVTRVLTYDDELVTALVLDDPEVPDVGTDTDVLSLYIKRALFEITDSPYNTYGDVFKALMGNIGCHVVMPPYLNAYLVSNVEDGSTQTEISENEVITLSVKSGAYGENISYKMFTCDQWEYTNNYSYTELNFGGSADLELTYAIPCYLTDLTADTASVYCVTSLFEADPATIDYSLVQSDSLKRKDSTGTPGTFWGTNFVNMGNSIALHLLAHEGAVYSVTLNGIKLGLEAHVIFPDTFAGGAFKDRVFRAKNFTYDLVKDKTKIELVEITEPGA